MSKYQIRKLYKKRCTNCLHDELVIIKVLPNEFTDKTVYMLWLQCSECGTNDNELVTENEGS
ncbi:hypothetical protein GLW08_10470 [Pontibacillus yanchengensis]|uniref:Uncharacterized protein n=1 Tax=Pontibacillus yanchengensis TaxID=462910 RepID=A0ACC7VGN0_9BACI|nr:hypothetical protein [Pontibacillus yanchengensis]MYL53760.1 hypothetical protein [Pontibacillus yanchengensis]